MTRPVLPWMPWVPATCASGHPLGRGLVTMSFQICPGCPASTDGRGHHVAYCRAQGCQAPAIYPPEHVGQDE